MLVYQHLNLPVISDRDFTLHVSWAFKKGNGLIRYRAVTGRGPAPRDGIVRLSHHIGTWQLQSIDQGRATQLRLQVSLDLSGLLPKWMARAGAGKELPALFNSIRQLAATEKQRRVACL
jgi:hypothetical protein